jgi:transcriptional regulator with XRE-family HTH domain
VPKHEESRDLGARLRRARLHAGLTQSELAARAGVKLDTLRSIEQGRTANPGVWTLAQLAEQLGETIDSLIHGNDLP